MCSVTDINKKTAICHKNSITVLNLAMSKSELLPVGVTAGATALSFLLGGPVVGFILLGLVFCSCSCGTGVRATKNLE